MKTLDANICCPSCQGPLSPRVLACEGCGVRVEAAFARSEFAGLGAELLHFLRIFVHCEGRIKDMEKALGVSYPTVKATMIQLKRALRMPESVGEAASTEASPTPTPAAKATPESGDRLAILSAMESGAMDYTEGLSRLKALRPK